MYDNANAITYLTEALMIMRRSGNRQAESQIYSNMGKSYKLMRYFPEAIKYFNRTLKYYTEIGDKSSVGHTLCEIGELYLELNDFCTSKKYFLEGLENSKAIDDNVNILRINIGLAKLYLKFKDEDRVSVYLNAAESLARSANSYKNLSSIYKIYSENYTIAGKLKEAKQFFNKYVEYFNKLNNIDEENKLQALILGHIKAGVNDLNNKSFFNPKTETEFNFV
jgi:tetratricopeptide (TPR) repeat protein